MKDRPIIMSGDNPRLILEGRKTQTRRVVVDKRLSPKLTLLELLDFLGGGGRCDGTGSRNDDEGLLVSQVTNIERIDTDTGQRHRYSGLLVQSDAAPGEGSEEIVCPYGVAGDRLWVREAFRDARNFAAGRILYRANESDCACAWKPSIHMPRWASRITLEITKVRVERLQDISMDDCKAEGVDATYLESKLNFNWANPHAYRHEYHDLWESLHGKGAWDKNPWIWVLEFKLV